MARCMYRAAAVILIASIVGVLIAWGLLIVLVLRLMGGR